MFILMTKKGTHSSSRPEANVSSIEPAIFSEAMEHKEWKKETLSECDSVLENGTWKLVDYPPNVKPIGFKLVCQIKYKSNGEIDKYKARLMDNIFSQQEGIDCDETFVPTTKWNTIRTVINLATQNG